MLVKSMIVDIGEAPQAQYAHAAAYVDAHNIGYNLIAQVTGKAYHASGTGVNVGHNAYLFIGEHIYREQLLYLRQGVFVDVVGEYLHVVSFYRLHIYCFIPRTATRGRGTESFHAAKVIQRCRISCDRVRFLFSGEQGLDKPNFLIGSKAIDVLIGKVGVQTHVRSHESSVTATVDCCGNCVVAF